MTTDRTPEDIRQSIEAIRRQRYTERLTMFNPSPVRRYRRSDGHLVTVYPPFRHYYPQPIRPTAAF